LQRVLADSESEVRHAARRALKQIRKLTLPVSAPLPAGVLEPPAPAEPLAVEDAAPPQPPEETGDTPNGAALPGIDIHLDGAHIRAD
jgi:hypothetical protein